MIIKMKSQCKLIIKIFIHNAKLQKFVYFSNEISAGMVTEDFGKAESEV